MKDKITKLQPEKPEINPYENVKVTVDRQINKNVCPIPDDFSDCQGSIITPILSETSSKGQETSLMEGAPTQPQVANETQVPQTLSTHITRAARRTTAPIPPFPIDGLPDFLRNLVTECGDVYQTPLDFWAAAFFVGTGVGIGNNMKLTGKYTNNTALWWLFVAPSGTGKTEPLDFALGPFKKLDAESYQNYIVQKAEYDNIVNLSSTERRSQNIQEIPLLPICKQTILNDFTPEAVAVVQGANPRGIILHRDELMGWIKDIGRYSKSGEVETMLSEWSGQSIVVNRKSQAPLRVDDPCITLAGGVQVKKIIDLANDGRADNGMIQRCMFVWPEGIRKSHYSKKTLSEQRKKEYEDYINKLRCIPDGYTLTLSEEAEVLYEEFYNYNADRANAVEVDFIKEMYAKLDIIALRIALIVHGMKMVCEGDCSHTIEPETMEYAICVTEYFRATALKVYEQLNTGTTSKIKVKDIILHFKNECGMTNQSEIARFLGVKQQYVNKIFSQG